MSKLIKIKDLVQDLVDKGATSVEDIHKSISDMPFDALKKLDPGTGTADSIKKAHDQTIGGVYNIIRKINKEVGKFAEQILDAVNDATDDDEENY